MQRQIDPETHSEDTEGNGDKERQEDVADRNRETEIKETERQKITCKTDRYIEAERYGI
jgi:hypothetical protein